MRKRNAARTLAIALSAVAAAQAVGPQMTAMARPAAVSEADGGSAGAAGNEADEQERDNDEDLGAIGLTLATSSEPGSGSGDSDGDSEESGGDQGETGDHDSLDRPSGDPNQPSENPNQPGGLPGQVENQEELPVPDAEAAPELKDGEALIPKDADESQVSAILAETLIKNLEELEADESFDAEALEWEYYCEGKSLIKKNKAWGSIGGFESTTSGALGGTTTYTHPALAENADGEYKVRLAGMGEGDAVTLHKVSSLESRITLNKSPEPVPFLRGENGEIDYDELEAAIFNAMVESTVPEDLTADDVTIEYYATAETGAVGNLGKSWVPLTGGKALGLSYPAIPEGTQSVRFTYNGDDLYGGTTVEGTIELLGLPEMEIPTNAAPYEAGLVMNDDMSINYDATAGAIVAAIVNLEESPVAAADFTVEYNAALTGLVDNFQPLDNNDALNLKKFGLGEWEIRLSWAETAEHKGGHLTADVTVSDGREATSVVLKSGASITYNMDAAVMKQALVDNVIDWENSSLPARETLSADDFTLEYYGAYTLLSKVRDITEKWVPIEGEDALVGKYPPMGAGDQKIRVTYKGNTGYHPSGQAEGTVSVAKTRVKLSVRWDNIFAGQGLPEDYITTNPSDDFDIYTVYGGMTSNVTTSIYLDLPDRFTNEDVLKVLDPVANAILGKSFSQMMQDGVTVGQLRQIFNTQELLDLLEKLNIDTGTFGQIMEAINKMPSVFDSMQVAFGAPKNTGLYTAVVITDSPNYETAVGMGMLLVRMNIQGVRMMWNQEISGGKMTAAQAKDFDFNVTLYDDGVPAADQSNVHYLYSGFTSRWRAYSSTTTPPSEPGRYSMTVVTLGGNYLAAPLTRAFQITK